jgi:hypothetical protein
MPSFTTDFQPIPATDIIVRGVTAGPAACRPVPPTILSSLAGVFAISADTAALIGALLPPAMPLQRAA